VVFTSQNCGLLALCACLVHQMPKNQSILRGLTIFIESSLYCYEHCKTVKVATKHCTCFSRQKTCFAMVKRSGLYYAWLKTSYTVQLISKITFVHIPDPFCMHFGWVPHLAKKGYGSYISLAAALLRGFALAQMHIMHVSYVSCKRSERVLHTSCMYFRCMQTLPWC